MGPVACRPEVLEEMSKQMFSHRSEEYRELHRETVDRLKELLETENKVFLFPSSGSGIMESSVRNCVEKKMLCCINGNFGRRYADVGEANGKIVERVEMEPGKPTTPKILDEKLREKTDVEAVSITYNETSIGLLNPLQDLAEVVKDYGKLLLVDAVSAMGGVEIMVDDWGIDVCFASSQKCFGVPPGLAVASVSEEALEKSKQVEERGWYFDLQLYNYYDREKDSTAMTPPIPQISALNKSLELMEEDGKESQFELYSKKNEKIVSGIKKLGLSTFPEEGYESPTVACINAPEKISGVKIYEKMREKGFELALGYGQLKKSTFRIGNMGYIRFEDIDSMLQALGEVLSENS